MPLPPLPEPQSVEEWLRSDDGQEGSLAQCLVLVAMLKRQGLISLEESSRVKSFVLQCSETVKLRHVLRGYERSADLRVVCRDLAGLMGDPCLGEKKPEKRHRRAKTHYAEPMPATSLIDSPALH